MMTRSELKEVFSEVVREELQNSNLIDGPTHTLHHQFLNEFMEYTRHAKKTALGVLIVGILGIFALGLAAWKGN